MRHILAGILVYSLAAARLFGGYAYSSTVAFTGAIGSTQNNITLRFSFNDEKLKTVANGGEIQNLCSRNGYSIPCDFVFTDDSTCTTITGGYTWGFDGDYSASAGTGNGWVMIPFYPTSGITPTICIGNAAVNTYRGGAAGAEFDTSTILALHLANGTTLSLNDYSVNANTVSNNGATPGTGKIDGGATTNGTSQSFSTSTTNFGAGTTATVEFWLNKSSFANNEELAVEYGPGTNASGHWEFFINPNSSGGKFEVDSRGGTTGADSDATFTRPSTGVHHYAFTFNVGSATHQVTAAYVDGVSQTLTYIDQGTPATTLSAQASYFMSRSNSALFTAGIIDEVRFSRTARSADWIATEYANQNSPPSAGAFTTPSLTISAPPMAGAVVY